MRASKVSWIWASSMQLASETRASPEFFADGAGVRVLLVGPGVIWLGFFLLATVALADLRYLLRRGAFVPAERTA